MKLSQNNGTKGIHSAWSWALLGMALLWLVALRVPLILNATHHLDSDLAVDGLTLREAVAGHWRWHYPGTPHMGIVPVLLSFPQAATWGANPFTLVSGGTVAFALLVAATYLFARRAFGPVAAAWSLVPLTFASTGAIWLSGRVTGGHLLAAAWQAGALALLHTCLEYGRWRDTIALGICCGLGVYIDSLFLVTLAGIVSAGVRAWWLSGRSRSGVLHALVFVPCCLAGVSPREIGARVDPHDAYQEQFRPIFQPEVLAQHAQILMLDCIPRLIAGHRIPGFQADPEPSALAGPGPSGTKGDFHPLALANTVVGLGLFLAAMVTLVIPSTRSEGTATVAVRVALVISGVATLAGFILNRNIFNSDNYRYLVGLLVPWSLGFGLAMRRLSLRGDGGLVAAMLCAITLAVLMTIDAARWYTRLGWIDEWGRPARVTSQDPALAWLDGHKEVGEFLGGYWDVYRLSFLVRRPVRGIPYRIYPNRFPEWSVTTGDHHPGIVIARPSPEGNAFLARALREGGKVLLRTRGIVIVSWP